MSAPVIRIGLCGFGTVGQGVWKHLTARRAELESRLGARLALHRVAVRQLKRSRRVKVPASRLTTDALAVARDPAIAIVCELIGGTGLAREVTLAALARGKIVVSANKALLCAHGAEIFAAARRGGGRFFFEASVAGGIPIVKAIREGLIANRFRLIYGILNGTCNYLLSRMTLEGAPYGALLAEAKALGYAEADEALDVEGWDAAHKAAILAYLAHGVWIKPGRMIVEGIDRITPADIRTADTLGYRIKLLAVITRDFEKDELFVRVHPTLLPKQMVLANVNGVFNGVAVAGDVVGTTTYIGRGAGQDATASAVIGDIADAVTLLTTGRQVGSPKARPAARRGAGVRLAPLEHVVSRYYVRMTVKDEPGVLARIAQATARHGVSIASVIQTGAEPANAASLILTTHQSNERAIRATLAALARLGSVLEKPLLLRIGDFAE